MHSGATSKVEPFTKLIESTFGDPKKGKKEKKNSPPGRTATDV
jgi:hypothetical protein